MVRPITRVVSTGQGRPFDGMMLTREIVAPVEHCYAGPSSDTTLGKRLGLRVVRERGIHRVVRISLCPSLAWMALACTPCCIRRAACECRREWKGQGSPTDARMAGIHTLERKRFLRKAFPCGDGKTRSSDAWLTRCSRRMGRIHSGRRIVRRPASVLDGPVHGTLS